MKYIIIFIILILLMIVSIHVKETFQSSDKKLSSINSHVDYVNYLCNNLHYDNRLSSFRD